MQQFAYLNGEILPVGDAKVSVNDIGLLRGFGIYEGLITHNRKLFMFADHMARLHRSADKMRLTVPASDGEIERALSELVEKNIPADRQALIRIILTGGDAVGVIEYNPETPTLYMLVTEFVPLEEKYLTEGCSILPVEYHRDLADIKSVNYINTVLLQKQRKQVGALEIVYTFQGKVLECGGSNIFIVKDGVLVTPKDEIVLGITRKAVFDVTSGVFAVEERTVTEEEMYGADEVFITGSFKEVVPVVRVGERTIANGEVGPATKKVIELFQNFTRSY